ncbi:MAG: hypothetical protein ACLP2Y_13995 [Limisphaerales bacterium]
MNSNMAKMFWGGTLSDFFLRYKNLVNKDTGELTQKEYCPESGQRVEETVR